MDWDREGQQNERSTAITLENCLLQQEKMRYVFYRRDGTTVINTCHNSRITLSLVALRCFCFLIPLVNHGSSIMIRLWNITIGICPICS